MSYTFLFHQMKCLFYLEKIGSKMASHVAFFDLISRQFDERLQWRDCWDELTCLGETNN